MSSSVDVCNMALSFLGDPAQVSAISPPDGSVQAARCARWYPMALDALLERHTWHFATKRVALSELSEDPPASWGFAYGEPTSCIKVLSVLLPDQTDDGDTQDFVRELTSDGQRAIFTNAEDATCRYIQRVTDLTRFTPLAVQALARLLASYLAGSMIKGKEGRAEAKAHLEIFEKIDLPAATQSDSNARQFEPYRTGVFGAEAARR